MKNDRHRVLIRDGGPNGQPRVYSSHEPNWRSVATSGYADLQVCDGHARCIVTRKVLNEDFIRIWGEVL